MANMTNAEILQAIGADGFKQTTKDELIKNIIASNEENVKAKTDYGDGVSVKGVLTNVSAKHFLAKINNVVESGKQWNSPKCIHPTNSVSPLGTSNFFHVHTSGAATGSRAGFTYKILDRNDFIQGYISVAWENPWDHNISDFVYCIKVSKTEDLLKECLDYCADSSISKIEGDSTFGPSSVELAENIRVASKNETTSSILISIHTDFLVENLLSRPPISIEHWMGDNWDMIGPKPLSQICVPGSHDSGTFEKTHRSVSGSDRRTKTQNLDINEQLSNGVRYFDLRPTDYEGSFYTHHSSDIPVLGRQGAIGVALSKAFTQIKDFCSKDQNKKELIILDFIKFLDWDTAEDMTGQQKCSFEEFVVTSLGSLLLTDNMYNLESYTVEQLINKGRIIALFPDSFPKLNPQKGIFSSTALNIRGSNSKTNELDSMLENQKAKLSDYPHNSQSNPIFQLYWLLQLSDTQNALGGLDVTGNSSIISLSRKANEALLPTFINWIKEDSINKIHYPNIIFLDDCSENDTKAVDLSLKVIRIVSE